MKRLRRSARCGLTPAVPASWIAAAAFTLSAAALSTVAPGCAGGAEITGAASGSGTGQATGSGGGGGGGSSACVPGATKPCYTGPESTNGVGLCVPGSATCKDDGSGYGACEGEVKPATDDCKTPEDEDCDGANAPCPGGVIWAKGAGDAADQRVNAIVVDASGNIIVTGAFAGSLNFGGQPLLSAGGFDVFVVKLDPSGTPIWGKRYGDVADQSGNGLALDASGNVIVTGDFKGSVDFGGQPLASAGVEDVFVVKLDAAGGHIWSKGFGSIGFQAGKSVAADPSDNIVLWATLAGTTSFGGPQLTSAGGTDVALVKLNAGGNHLYSKIYGGASADTAGELALDADGNVFVTGSFADTMNLGGGSLVSAGGADVFTAHFTVAGIHQWSRRFGDVSDQTGRSIAVDQVGNMILGGAFLGTIDFGGGELKSAGSEDIFVAKLGPDGAHVWSRAFGDNAQQVARAVAVDSVGNVLVAGSLAGAADFGGGSLASSGTSDAFLAKLDSQGAHVFSFVAGDADDQSARALAIDPSAAVLLGGQFKGTLAVGGVMLSATGSNDAFMAKIAP